MPSNWENVAHNGLICFFQHNYIPTFEQWLWDRVCVLSTWFGDICCSRRDLYVLQKVTITLFQILFAAAFYAKTNVTSRAWKAALNRNAIGRRHSARRQRITPFDLRCASLPVSTAIFYKVQRHARCTL